MFLKRKGFPEDGELVFCTVTNVQYNSVFVKIEEYEKQGLIHISEISPGRIRNIRDFVKEGKMIVCKVIKIDQARGNIDLSLRRVTEMQKRMKTDERKQEQKAEKIIESLANQLKKPAEKVYEEVAAALLPKYDLLQSAFEDVVENNVSLEKEGVPHEYVKPLEQLVKDKIKPKQVIVSGTISIKSYAENGVDIVKNSLLSAKKVSPNVIISYLGAGNYSIEVEAKEYKEAEKILKEAIESAEKVTKASKASEFSFKKKEKD
jgi:translation initiation factor 2 subunit 1